MAHLVVSSPAGRLTIRERAGAIVDLGFGAPPGGAQRQRTPLLAEAERQLAAYFAGRRRSFELPLDPAGTPFQQAVWGAMRAIPFGQIRTYGALARELNSAPRAVGGACRANPIAIVIPCHRVVAAGGQLGGYSGGTGAATKRYLLRHEGAVV